MKSSIIFFTFLSFTFLAAQHSKLSPEHYKEQRDAFRNLLPENSVAVLFSAPIRNRANDVDYVYHQDPNFFYLTGWHQPHSALMIYKNPQRDGAGQYREKIYVPERDAYMEMWYGKRYSLSDVKKLGFERVAERAEFKNDITPTEQFDKVLFFEFKNDIRNQTMYVLKNGQRLKVEDPNDLFDLKANLRAAVNFPQDFNKLRHSAYQEIMEADENNIEEVREILQSIVARDSMLSQDNIINKFLNEPTQNYYKEAQRQTAFALRNYNFDIETLPMIMADMREIKSKDEIQLLKKAVAISVVGQIEVMKAMHPGMSEREIQGIHEFVYRKYGAADEGYPSIVGAGENGCILHYIENDEEEIENQLVLMDLGAEYYGYTADVTRTIPANGVFSPEQRALYQIVYDAQEAAINASKAGTSFGELYYLSYDIVAKGLMELKIIEDPSEARSYYPHGLSHHIGLDVHDPGNYGVLAPNMVVTIEPGIYIPANSPCDSKWWNIGIRIEDDVLITPLGPENLSAGVPRDVEGIETLMREDSVLKEFILPELETLVQ
ncbi:MAG: aminopeptidase P N-terminal domain-containing protein [Flavobacteriaceae bacterium]|nr:aminopeptidase P N-terminal domain-containing protein [Flavobacteriaceae bacterium]